jgi:hypothetical protein
VRSNKPIVIKRLRPNLFGHRWEVEQGEGEELNHSTGHSDIEDALSMVRILMRGIEKDENANND